MKANHNDVFQNAPCQLGTTAYLVLRDRERVDFVPASDDFVNQTVRFKAQRKDNIGVLEATGTVIADDRVSFEEMQRWNPTVISRQVGKMVVAVAPAGRKVAEFATTVRNSFPG
jgi:hypothetical protein